MATRSGIPALTMLRTALRLKSWNSSPGIPICVHAVFQDFLKSPHLTPSN
jgi:hypothetical protein